MSDWALVVAALIGSAWVIAGVLMRVVALGIIPGNRRPSTGMAWLLVILLSPLLGFVLFAFFGSSRLGQRRSERQERAHRTIAAHASQMDTTGHASVSTYLNSVAHLSHKLGSLPLMAGNEVELIDDYHASIQAMTEAVSQASTYVNVEFYITALDPVTAPLMDALEAATDRGVSVRVLFDHLGSRGIPGYKQLLSRLSRSQIQFREMLPLRPLRRQFRRPDLRNHRKLLVVDGIVGFTGSQNLTEPSYNKPKNHKLGREWIELMVRVRGPVVGALDAVFAADWYTETDEILDVVVPESPIDAGADGALPAVTAQVVPSGPGLVAENNLRLFTSLIYSAVERVSLTSPYFVPDESLLYAVTTAAHRGVSVELFVSEVSDQFMVGHAQNSYYRALLDAGVRIYLYPAPYVLHSKHFTIDDSAAVIGSSNMDMRSFALNYEISLMLLGPQIVSRLREVEDGYRALSKELTLEQWLERPLRLRYVDNVMRLTAALQ